MKRQNNLLKYDRIKPSNKKECFTWNMINCNNVAKIVDKKLAQIKKRD